MKLWKRFVALMLAAGLCSALLTGCSGEETIEDDGILEVSVGAAPV